MNIYGIIGDPITHTLSPKMHNAAYVAHAIYKDSIYIPFHVTPDKLKLAINGIKGLNIKGISVTIPHKEAVISLLDHVDLEAKFIGAVNTIVNCENRLYGYNTDLIGITEPIREKFSNTSRKLNVAILGTGGVARSAIFAMKKVGFNVSIFARDLVKATLLANEFQVNYFDIKNTAQLNNNDIIFNGTSVGMGNQQHLSPIDLTSLRKDQLIFESIYSPAKTKLLKHALELGCCVIDGKEMLAAQGAAQFKLFTGIDISSEEMLGYLS
jgi:shikimate dehydrogenase